MENNGSIHQAVCQAGGTVWPVEASKRLDEKIRGGRRYNLPANTKGCAGTITHSAQIIHQNARMNGSIL